VTVDGDASAGDREPRLGTRGGGGGGCKSALSSARGLGFCLFLVSCSIRWITEATRIVVRSPIYALRIVM